MGVYGMYDVRLNVHWTVPTNSAPLDRPTYLQQLFHRLHHPLQPPHPPERGAHPSLHRRIR